MDLLPIFESINNLDVSVAIRESVWFAAIIQAVHLVSLAVFAGALLVVDLRLLGRGLKDRAPSDVARDAQPWLVWSLVALFVTGIPQLMGNAIREYYSVFFWIKMVALLLAIVFTFTVRRTVALANESQVSAGKAKTIGLLSIVLWFTVAVTARLIGLFT